jgi:hypothetical protein
VSEIQVPDEVSKLVTKNLPPSLTSFTVKYYTSNDDVATLTKAFDADFATAGLKKVGEMPSTTNSGEITTLYANDTVGVAANFSPVTGDVATDTKGFQLAQVSPEAASKFLDTIKGKKTVLVAFIGPDILKLINLMNGAAPTATTAAASATTAASAGATNGAASATPPAADLTEIKTDPAIINAVITQLGTGNKVEAKYYTSNDDQDKVASALDTSLVAAGYKFVIPGATKPGSAGDGSLVGLYSKDGAPDIFFAIQSATDANITRTIGATSFKSLSADLVQQFASQLKSQKSYAAILVGPDLMKLVLG